MVDARELLGRAVGRVTIRRRFSVRVLDVSRGGCLLETRQPIPVGATGHLRFAIDGDEHAGAARISRTVLVGGARPLFRTAVEFRYTASPATRSLAEAVDRLEYGRRKRSNE